MGATLDKSEVTGCPKAYDAAQEAHRDAKQTDSTVYIPCIFNDIFIPSSKLRYCESFVANHSVTEQER